MTTSPSAIDINGLIASFTDRVPGVKTVVLISPDGLPMVMSQGLDREVADSLASVVSRLIGLAYDWASRGVGGGVSQVIIEMHHAYLFVTDISDGSCLAVSTDASADSGLIAYEMARLTDQCDVLLTPEVRAELMESLP